MSPFFAPIALLLLSNVFMTFAWVSGGWPKANEIVRGTISSRERPERKRRAGGDVPHNLSRK
jgi:hypothetical protein